jgi:hypothetical protein
MKTRADEISVKLSSEEQGQMLVRIIQQLKQLSAGQVDIRQEVLIMLRDSPPDSGCWVKCAAGKLTFDSCICNIVS